MFAVLRKGVEDGEIRADVDLQWVSDLLVAPVMVAVLTHRPRVSRAQLEFTIDTILRGIGPQRFGRMIRVSEHRGRVSAEKRNERNERPMSGVPAKPHSVSAACMCTRAKRR